MAASFLFTPRFSEVTRTEISLSQPFQWLFHKKPLKRLTVSIGK